MQTFLKESGCGEQMRACRASLCIGPLEQHSFLPGVARWNYVYLSPGSAFEERMAAEALGGQRAPAPIGGSRAARRRVTRAGVGPSETAHDTHDEVWLAVQAQARQSAEQEPLLSSFLHASVVSHSSLASALAFVLANLLADDTLHATQLIDLFHRTLHGTPPSTSPSHLATLPNSPGCHPQSPPSLSSTPAMTSVPCTLATRHAPPSPTASSTSRASMPSRPTASPMRCGLAVSASSPLLCNPE